jgi:hypothetical protein
MASEGDAHPGGGGKPGSDADSSLLGRRHPRVIILE